MRAGFWVVVVKTERMPMLFLGFLLILAVFCTQNHIPIIKAPIVSKVMSKVTLAARA